MLKPVLKTFTDVLFQYYLFIVFPLKMLQFIDDFLNYLTLLRPELEKLTQPESTEGGSILSICFLFEAFQQ